MLQYPKSLSAAQGKYTLVERVEGSHLEILDRVLDKGIAIDPWVRVVLASLGLDLRTMKARLVVASVATYREKWEELAPASMLPEAARWRTAGPAQEELLKVRHHTAAVGRGARRNRIARQAAKHQGPLCPGQSTA